MHLKLLSEKQWRDIKIMPRIYLKIENWTILIQHKKEFKGNSFKKHIENILYWSKKLFIKKLSTAKDIGLLKMLASIEYINELLACSFHFL